jgi:hypothetical protein
METYQVGLIALGLFALLGLFAFPSWRKKSQAQARQLEKPEFIDSKDFEPNALYVATTFQHRRLDRVHAHGLAHRGRAKLIVQPDRLEIHRVGETSFSIPAHSIIELTENTAVIDRAVEKDGLSTISWKLGEEVVETHFRFTSADVRKDVESQIRKLVGVVS